MKKIRLVLLSSLTGLFLCGCTSTRFTTTMAKQRGCNIFEKVSFDIVEAHPPVYHHMSASPTGYAISDENDLRRANFDGSGYNISSEDFQRKLCDVAYSRYPEIFKMSPDSVPVFVRVHGKNSSSIIPSLMAEVLTLAVLGGLLPLPITGTSEFSVETRLHDSFAKFTMEDVAFTRKDIAWMTVLTPLGLIPIPGQTESPKTSEIGQLKSIRQGGVLTLEGIVDAIVARLDSVDLSSLDSDKYIYRNGRIYRKTDTVSDALISSAERLKKLKELRDSDVITEQEYELRRKKIVDEL